MTHFPINLMTHFIHQIYRQFSNIRRTQSQNINIYRLVVQLALPNQLKTYVTLRMKM